MRAVNRPSATVLGCVALGLASFGCALVYDYPSIQGENTEARCADHEDNDLDGLVDCKDSDCAPYCRERTKAACSDGVDNDVDGKTDCADSNCKPFCLENTDEACHDGVDNDVDGKTDCADSECKPFCLENTDETCHDGKDNDFDGVKDCEVPECAEYCVEATAETCHDGKDNDQDGKIDCADVACATFCPEADKKTCSDGVDNDSDGKVDCDDADCDGFCAEEDAVACNDGRDNDADGLVDAADPRCWPGAPPDVRHCADAAGIEFTARLAEGSNTEVKSPRWLQFGLHDGNPIFHPGQLLPVPGTEPPDSRGTGPLIFEGYADSNAFGGHLGTFIHAREFAGTFEGFELSFRATLHEHATLRAGIVPVAQASLISGVTAGAESALVSLTIDSTVVPAVALLDVAGTRTTAPLPGGTDFQRIALGLDAKGFVATFTTAAGVPPFELRGPPPATLELEAARLVFWGGAAANSSGTLDDVYLHVPPDRPCGFSAPQIPGRTCDFHDALSAFGQVTSLASATAGGFCALVTASKDAGAQRPDALTAWTSDDGATWRAAALPTDPPIALDVGLELVGAGIAEDGDGHYLAAVAQRDGDVKLGFAVADTCGKWGKLDPGPTLFPDAEPPSYVIAGGEHAVYFTRAPTDTTQRTLWRVTRGASDATWSDPELLAELPPNVASPVTVQRVGRHDLVITHPIAASAGVAGIGLLVGDESAHSWKAVTPSPILAIPPKPEDGGGTLRFDDLGVLSAALSWTAKGGFFLYGASSSLGLTSSSARTTATSVGTAVTVPAKSKMPSKGAGPALCRDGSCSAGEDCESCPADCPCDGVPILTDAFALDKSWNLSGVVVDAFASDTNHPGINFLYPLGQGYEVASVALDRPIIGDFEVSVDLVADPASGCGLLVGVGDPSTNITEIGQRPSGIFMQVAPEGCIGVPLPPLVFSPADLPSQKDGVLACTAGESQRDEVRRHFVLRREGQHVSTSFASDDACGVATASLDRAVTDFALPFAILAMDSRSCPAGSGRIEDLRVRLLDDPDHCPDSTTRCVDERAQPLCVDLSVTSEHCGACNHACGELERCVGGACECATDGSLGNGTPASGILSCSGSCVQSMTDPAHCGACDTPCNGNCSGGTCFERTATCASPRLVPPGGTNGTLIAEQLAGPFAGGEKELHFCGARLSPAFVYSWRPSVTGNATLGAHISGVGLLGGSPFMGISTSAICTPDDPGLVCSDSLLLNDNPTLVFPVTAGTTYWLVVGLDADNPLNNGVTGEMDFTVDF